MWKNLIGQKTKIKNTKEQEVASYVNLLLHTAAMCTFKLELLVQCLFI